MAYLFYYGAPIHIEFVCEGINNRAVNPVSARISVFDSDGQAILQDQFPSINENAVAYDLDQKLTKPDEDYVAIFELLFAIGAVRKHSVMFSVVSREVPKNAAGTPVAQLEIDSSDDAIENAVRQTLRQNRRKGVDNKENIKAVYSTAQSRIGKRIGR